MLIRITGVLMLIRITEVVMLIRITEVLMLIKVSVTSAAWDVQDRANDSFSDYYGKQAFRLPIGDSDYYDTCGSGMCMTGDEVAFNRARHTEAACMRVARMAMIIKIAE